MLTPCSGNSDHFSYLHTFHTFSLHSPEQFILKHSPNSIYKHFTHTANMPQDDIKFSATLPDNSTMSPALLIKASFFEYNQMTTKA